MKAIDTIPPVRPLLPSDRSQNVRLGLVGLEGQDPATLSPVDIDIELSRIGVTERELASSTNGSILVNFGAGMVNSFGASLYFRDFITNLISTVNPFARETGRH